MCVQKDSEVYSERLAQEVPVCMYVCMYGFLRLTQNIWLRKNVYVCIYVCIYICMYVGAKYTERLAKE